MRFNDVMGLLERSVLVLSVRDLINNNELTCWAVNEFAHLPKKRKYSRLSLSRLRLSRITAYLEEKIWSFFKRRNLTSGNKVFWLRGETAPKEQFLPFSTIFSVYILT